MSDRIYTRCPSCQNDTLIVNKGRLLCTWLECKDPISIDQADRTIPALMHANNSLRNELAATQQKLIEAEARVERLKTVRNLCENDDDYRFRVEQILSESPSDALRAYEQERFRERTEGAVEALESINACHGGLRIFSCPCPHLLTDAIVTLKKERGK